MEFDPERPIGPLPRRWPPDWWRCVRLGPVSGYYYGEMTSPNNGKYGLELRIDIDSSNVNSPVLKKVSGDVYQLYKFGRFIWKVHKESWIVNKPKIYWSKCSVGIKGAVSKWSPTFRPSNVQIVIPWKWAKIGPAEVKFSTPFSNW